MHPTNPSLLTSEQEAIVRHEKGPALVFAVAGAGKTTSMVYRIERLVRSGTRPRRILATSFGRATVNDISQALDSLGVAGVDCLTIHGIGHRIISEASRRGLGLEMLNEQNTDTATMPSILARRAIQQLARNQEVDQVAIGIDSDELVSTVSAWKQNLVYADLEGANLPVEALEHAEQAQHDNSNFVTLYELYEEERHRNNWLTFDDMLVLGWEALIRFPDVKTRFQNLYDQIMVDEFQDVNKVQYLILDILSASHRNYMAIGDDDQCIYEWRGAQPKYILNFKEAYSKPEQPVCEYLITENFRSKAPHIVLANHVIRHNQRRRQKQLNLTQGFEGDLHLIPCADSLEEARYIVQHLQTHIENGGSTADAAVLIRAYAQTPFIETALIEAGIPYAIVGNNPFYKRKEVATLLHYLIWANLERAVKQNRTHGGYEQQRKYVTRFKSIIWQPNRYVSKTIVDQVVGMALQNDGSVMPHLIGALSEVRGRTAERLEKFIDTVDGLLERLDQPADQTLKWLIQSIGYEEYLRRTSAIKEIGEGKVRTTLAFVDFAQGHPNSRALVSHIAQMAFGNIDGEPDSTWLKILTIHRAKGLQWPIVFIPDCNEGILPMISGDPEKVTPPELDPTRITEADLEAERRLFYVAVTRPKQELHLLYTQKDPSSRFLLESDASDIITTCTEIRRALALAPSELSDRNIQMICSGVERLAGLKRFFESRWKPINADELLTRFDTVDMKIAEAQAAIATYEATRTPYNAELASYTATRQQSHNGQLAASNGKLLRIKKVPDQVIPAGERISFEKQDRKVIAVSQWGEIGPICMNNSQLLGQWPWDRLTACSIKSSSTGRTLFATLIVPGPLLVSSQQAALPPLPEEPEEPKEDLATCATETFISGYQFIRNALVNQVLETSRIQRVY